MSPAPIVTDDQVAAALAFALLDVSKMLITNPLDVDASVERYLAGEAYVRAAVILDGKSIALGVQLDGDPFSVIKVIPAEQAALYADEMLAALARRAK